MKLLRKILLILGILIIIVILTIAVLFFILVNPNRFKNQIIHQVYARTGMPVQIQGNMEWIAAPKFGLRIHQLRLPSAQVQQADIYLNWPTLISRQIKFEEVFLKQFSTETDKVIFKKAQHFKISGDLQINIPQQSFNVTDLNINSEDVHASGEVSGSKHENGLQFTGKMNMPRFSGWPGFPAQIKNAKIRFKTDSGQHFSGDVQAENFIIKNYSFDKLVSPFLADLQKIRFTAIQGKFAGGDIQGKVNLSYFTIKPRYQIEVQFHQVEMQQVLRSKILSGPADLNVNLNINENINGKIKFIMRNGVLNYINLIKQIQAVRQFLQNNEVEINDNSTHFSQLTASGIIENDLFTNPDLNLQSNFLQANGKGSINFASNQLDYILKVDAYGLKLPLKIKGELNNPKVKIDLGHFKFALPF